MQEIIDFIVNEGIAVVCVAYLIYFQSTTMKEIQQILHELVENIQLLNTRVENVEKKTDDIQDDLEKIKENK